MGLPVVKPTLEPEPDAGERVSTNVDTAGAGKAKPRVVGLDWAAFDDDEDFEETPASPVVTLPTSKPEVPAAVAKPAPAKVTGPPAGGLPSRPAASARLPKAPTAAPVTVPQVDENPALEPEPEVPVLPAGEAPAVQPATPTLPVAPPAAAVKPQPVPGKAKTKTPPPTKGEGVPAVPTSPTPVVSTSVDPTFGDDWEEEEELDIPLVKEPAKGKGGRGKKGFSISERDIRILRFLSRYRYATYPQIALAFDATPLSLRQRFPQLARQGLVVKKKIGQTSYSVWLPTKSGIAVGGQDLTVPEFSWGTVAHTVGLVDLGVRFEKAGELVVTEREIRSAERGLDPTDYMNTAAAVVATKDVPLFVVPMQKADYGQQRHYPDLVLVREPTSNGASKSVAIELELNAKRPADWRRILRAYMHAPNLGGVVYYTHDKRIFDGVMTAAREVGTPQGFVQVKKYQPGTDSPIHQILANR